MTLPDGWHECASTASALEAELQRELSPGHPLFGKTMRAIARRLDCDDALFTVVGASTVAMVHLTWSGRPEGVTIPRTELYDSPEVWRIFVEAPSTR